MVTAHRLISVLTLTAALLSCGEKMDCPTGYELSTHEHQIFTHVANMLDTGVNDPPLITTQPVDNTCPGTFDIRAPSDDECVGAFYVPACELIVVPADIYHLDPAWYDLIIAHESLHHLLKQKYGNSDNDHSRQEWNLIG